MSAAAALWTVAGSVAAAAAVAVLLRAARRYPACSAACRWLAAAAAAWGAAFIAVNLDTGPITGMISPLTLADLLGLLALPVLVAGLVSLGSGASAPDRTEPPGDGLALRPVAGRQAPGRIEAARRLAARRPAVRRLTRAESEEAERGHAGTAMRGLSQGSLARVADACLLAAALFILGWLAVLRPAYETAQVGAGTFAVGLIHPLADLVVLGGVLVVAVRAGWIGLPPFLALLAATAGDFLAVQARTSGTHPGTWPLVAWLASICLLAATPVLLGAAARRNKAEQPDQAAAVPDQPAPDHAGADRPDPDHAGRRDRPGQRDMPGSEPQLPVWAAAGCVAAAALVTLIWSLTGASLAPAVVVVICAAVLLLAVRLAGLLRQVSAAALHVRESGRQFRELADRTSDAVLLCDIDSTIRYVSPAVSHYGYSPASLLGTQLSALLHPEDRAGAIRAARAAGRGSPAPGRLSCRVRSADGTWQHVEAAISPYRERGAPERLLITARDVSDQVALRRQVTHLTFHDGLTGLPNRAYLEERAKDLLARTGQPGSEPPAEAGAIFVDLDGFTAVNDLVGHGAADLLLAQAALRLRAVAPPQDTVARWGGDEFAVLIESGISPQEIVDVAERLAGGIAAEPFRVADRDISLTASVGVALALPAESEHLLRNADVAMSRAKASGGGRVEVFASHMHSDVVRRLELTSDLRAAVAEGSIGIEYQPIVELDTSRVTGVEALVRWSRHGSQVPPGEFLGVAEDSGLIVPLGDRVLRHACLQVARWRESGWEIGLAVNFSLRQVGASRFTDTVLAALDDSGLPATALILEVAERVLIEGADSIVAGLARLRRRGIRLAIDDFGTGYASLAYLRQLPVDIIKIDPSFVAGLGTDAVLAMLTRTIVRVGHGLGIEVVAEGIEQPKQLEMLRAMGCSRGQGYLVARPMAATGIEAALAREDRLRRAGRGDDRSAAAAAVFLAAPAPGRGIPADALPPDATASLPEAPAPAS
ncbi:MAG: putative bifunctional diguanylate cyclase/phosphodiesterase [Streptosporangiaceae bacterium]|jgi:diguanylate cyclase (GGDEF)-like protein/PAS domain S-box-containing protein